MTRHFLPALLLATLLYGIAPPAAQAQSVVSPPDVRALKPGERVPVTLHFQNAGAVPVKLSVGPITATGPSARHGVHH